jgi:hypothetical protein
MKEYLAEVSYGDITKFLEFKNEILRKFIEIEKEHFYFKVERNNLGVYISQDVVNSVIRLKPLPDDMPQDLKDEIINLFNSLPPFIENSGL